MKRGNKKNAETVRFEKGINRSKEEQYVLKLYITGMTPQSSLAVHNIRHICEDYLKGRYLLDVIDLYAKPILAKGEQIIAAPTLIKSLPLPLRRIIGDMSNHEKVLVGLDIKKIDT